MRQAFVRNDVRQYEGLSDEWWRVDSPFAMLRWLAAARAELVPRARRPGAVLVDLGCGGGVFAPHALRLGYRPVGVDLVAASLRLARDHGVTAVRADVRAVPLPDGCADVVCAGQLLEHVPDPSTVVTEAGRILRPGGTLVIDCINQTAVGRFFAVTVAEWFGGEVVRGIHDPDLFVPPALVVSAGARHGVNLAVRGVRPAAGQLLRWLVTRRGDVRIVPAMTSAVLYQAWGVKEG